jgi:hypothetical protein
MKTAELIKIAQRQGVEVEEVCGEWSAFIEIPYGLSVCGAAVFTRKKLQSLVNVLAKHNIKINN